MSSASICKADACNSEHYILWSNIALLQPLRTVANVSQAPEDMSQEPAVPPLQLLQKRKSTGESCGLSLSTDTSSSFNAYEF